MGWPAEEQWHGKLEEYSKKGKRNKVRVVFKEGKQNIFNESWKISINRENGDSILWRVNVQTN